MTYACRMIPYLLVSVTIRLPNITILVVPKSGASTAEKLFETSWTELVNTLLNIITFDLNQKAGVLPLGLVPEILCLSHLII